MRPSRSRRLRSVIPEFGHEQYEGRSRRPRIILAVGPFRLDHRAQPSNMIMASATISSPIVGRLLQSNAQGGKALSE